MAAVYLACTSSTCCSNLASPQATLGTATGSPTTAVIGMLLGVGMPQGPYTKPMDVLNRRLAPARNLHRQGHSAHIPGLQERMLIAGRGVCNRQRIYPTVALSYRELFMWAGHCYKRATAGSDNSQSLWFIPPSCTRHSTATHCTVIIECTKRAIITPVQLLTFCCICGCNAVLYYIPNGENK